MNSEGTSSLTKDTLRRSMKEALRATSEGQRRAWSSRIRELLKENDSWVPPTGGIVAMFGGIRTEPDVVPLLSWLEDRGVRTAFFTISGQVMTPRVVKDVAHLQSGQLSVFEPDPVLSEAVEVRELDVVLVPGLAFSRSTGARLGRGKGHYDRVLELLPENKLCLGVCFALQLHDEVPLERHDRHVHALVTETGLLAIEDRRSSSIQ